MRTDNHERLRVLLLIQGRNGHTEARKHAERQHRLTSAAQALSLNDVAPPPVDHGHRPTEKENT